MIIDRGGEVYSLGNASDRPDSIALWRGDAYHEERRLRSSDLTGEKRPTWKKRRSKSTTVMVIAVAHTNKYILPQRHRGHRENHAGWSRSVLGNENEPGLISESG